MAEQKSNNPLLMGVVNLTPDSFYAPSRAQGLDAVRHRMRLLRRRGCSIFDFGAVSTRPGADPVDLETEWGRLEDVLVAISRDNSPIYPKTHATLGNLAELPPISIDTSSSEIVRRAYEIIGPFIVNDISAGEDDPEMLGTVARLKLPYIAMHKRGNPKSMDSLCDYPQGVVNEVISYFKGFSAKAEAIGVDNWILDPGFGFAKTDAQNLELLENLSLLRELGRPILAGIADKRFTKGHSRKARTLASAAADILRIH